MVDSLFGAQTANGEHSAGHAEVMELVHKAMLMPGYDYRGARTAIYAMIRDKYKHSRSKHQAQLVAGDSKAFVLQ